MFADFLNIQAWRRAAGQLSNYFDLLKHEQLLYDSLPIHYTTFTILILSLGSVVPNQDRPDPIFCCDFLKLLYDLTPQYYTSYTILILSSVSLMVDID